MFNKYMSERLQEKLKPTGVLTDEMFNDENFEKAGIGYLDIAAANPENISYIPVERLDRFEGNYWDETLRRRFAIMAKPIKVLNKLRELGHEEARHVLYRLTNMDDYDIFVVSGSDIPKYYNEEYYHEIRGSLGNSCMSQKASLRFKFYSDYCKMVIMKHRGTGKIVARAMIWQKVVSNGGYATGDIIGRIYSTDNLYEDAIKIWADENDYRRFSGGRGSNSIVRRHEIIDVNDFKPFIYLDGDINNDYHYLPYIDNFYETGIYEEKTDDDDYGDYSYVLYMFKNHFEDGSLSETDCLLDPFDYHDDYHCEYCSFSCSECYWSENGDPRDDECDDDWED